MRLTKKSDRDYTGYEPVEELVKKNNASPIIGKLGQLEDVEEELGIDLVTLFKALKNGFWVRLEVKEIGSKNKKYSYEFVNPKDDYDVHNEVSLDFYHLCIYDWDNYMQWRCGVRRFKYDLKGTYKAEKGFAWALTREELEK